jgi:diguanylate cyclase (GGDEF)-like protein
VVAARRSLRAADLLFRHGSDEFIVLLLQTDRATAQSIGTRLNDAAKAEQIGQEPSFGVTIVTVTIPEDGVSIDELIHSAVGSLRRLRNQQQDRPPESIH